MPADAPRSGSRPYRRPRARGPVRPQAPAPVTSDSLMGEARVHAYAKFLETVRFFNAIPVVPFDSACEQRVQELRSQRLRVGSHDLCIAATALVQNLTVVTRNRRDFEHVPRLLIEDWSQ